MLSGQMIGSKTAQQPVIFGRFLLSVSHASVFLGVEPLRSHPKATCGRQVVVGVLLLGALSLPT